MHNLKLYRVTYLISSKLDSEEAIQVSKQLTSFVQNKGGKIQREKELVKKTLAYPIKKDNLAYLGDVIFNLDAKDLPDFQKFASSQKNIVRFLLINDKPTPQKPLRSRYKGQKADDQEKPSEPESVDQKLNKILGD